MFTALLLSTSLLLADPIPERPLTLTELVDIALSHNPDSKAAWWQANRAAALVGVAKSAYFPTLDFNTYASKGQEYEFTNGPNRKFTETGVNLNLNMLLFDFGERSCDVTMSKKALEAANWEADFSLQKVMIHTLESAYAVLHAQEVVIAARITRDDAKKMLDISEHLQNAGLTPITDVYTSRATLSEMKMNLAKWQAELDIRKSKLAQAVGFSADKAFEIAPLSALTAPHIEDTKTLLAKAKNQRADLLAKAAKLQESQASLEKSYASYLPKLSVSATGGLQHYQHDHTKHGNYSVTANLAVPLFSGLDSIYKNRVAYAETKTSLEELAALELAIAFEVVSACKQHEAASLMLEYAEISLENNKLAYEAALEKYKAGKESMFQEVSNALQMLAQARVRYSEIKTDWLTSLARIAYATGTNPGRV